MLPLLTTLFVAATSGFTATAAGPPARTAQTTSERADFAVPARGDAYFAYLRGRRLEGEGDLDGALAAYREAVRLDPRASDPAAALASAFLKKEDVENATSAAEAALALDPDNGDAHWVLGMVFASEVTDSQGRPVADAAARASRAIGHLEKARASRKFDLNLLLSLGRLYVSAGDYPLAIERLTVLAEEAPGVPQVVSLLARAYTGAGRTADAIEALEGVVEGGGRVQPMLLELATLYERENRWLDAATAYGRALGQSYRSIDLRMRQATALLNADAPKEAREVMIQTAKANPTDSTALYLLADVERQGRDFVAAEATARRLMGLDKGDLRGAYMLSRVLEDQFKYNEIVRLLTPITEKFSAGSDAENERRLAVMLQLGEAQEELGRLDAAVAMYDKARTLAADDPAPHIAIIQAYQGAKQFPRALGEAEAARKRFPNDRRLLRLHAQVLQQAGQVEGAVALLNDAATSGHDTTMTIALAQVYTDAGRFQSAEDLLRRAAESSPADPLLKFQLGAVLEQQQQFARAEEAFRSVLSIDPAHAPTLNYLGYMLADSGQRLDEAIALLTKAVSLDPTNGSYLDSLGWAYFKQNDLSRAKDLLARAADQLQKNSVVQDHYGDVLFKLGDREGAASAWRRALAGDLEQIKKEDLERKLRQVPSR